LRQINGNITIPENSPEEWGAGIFPSRHKNLVQTLKNFFRQALSLPKLPDWKTNQHM